MKKIVSLMLALTIMLTMCLQITGNANAAEQQIKALPQVGEVISGFRVANIGNMDLINAKTVVFEHEKTGAKLMYIQNDDINRTFQIAFKTPAVDNTGVNHIIEHSTISGSKKYPLKNVMFSVSSQTYSTFINAFTSNTETCYPVSSMSEDQLLKLTDVYLDCTFNPSVYQNKNIFNREAWRYELSDASAPLTLNGTVYNEMKGALGSIAEAARCNTRKALFPNSVQSNISGGDPDYITSLTYENLLKTHSQYYNPTNCLMVLYGKLDYERFLKYIDSEYLSKYDKKTVNIDTGKVEPFKAKTEKTYVFPMATDANTKNAGEIDYAYALSDMSEQDIIGISVLCSMLNLDNSQLKQEFNKKHIGGSITVGYDTSSIQPVLTFSVLNADVSRKAELKKLVDDTISDIVKNGMDKDTVDATISSYLLSQSTLTEAGNLGFIIASAVGNWWSNLNDLNYLNNLISNTKEIRTKAKGDYFESLTRKYIMNNNHAALVTTVPEAGLAEKQSQKLKTDLEKAKAEMSKAQIDKIVSATKEFNDWNKKEDDVSLIKGLQAISASNLPEELKQYPMQEKTLYGVKSLTAEANVSETCNTRILFDTSNVKADKLHFLQLYSELLGKISTKKYNQQKLTALEMRYFGGGVNLTTVSKKNSKEFTPYLSVSWLGLMSDYDKSLELVNEILLNTDLTKTTEILNYVKSQKSNLKYTFDNNPIAVQMSRTLSTIDAENNYNQYMSGLDYYSFLNEVEQLLANKPDTVTSELKAIADLVLSKTNMITMFGGSQNGINTYEQKIGSIVNSLKENKVTRQDYSVLPKPSDREGIIANGTVQYNMMAASYDKMNTAFSGKLIPIGVLIYDNYLTPKIRFENGAYDNLINFTQKGFFMVSYRDPSIKETYDIYKGLPTYLKNISLTQEDLNRYILRVFSEYTTPKGELSGADTQLMEYLGEWNKQDKLKLLKEIKSATIQDVKDFGSNMDSFIKNASVSTVGSAEKINANKDLFKSIIILGNEQQKKTVTRADLINMLFPGVKDADKIAIQQGFITGDSKGNYYMDKTITKQELAVIISRILKNAPLQKVDKGVKISDISSVNSWAKDGVILMVETGIMKLDDQGRINPKEEVSATYLQELFTIINQKASGK